LTRWHLRRATRKEHISSEIAAGERPRAGDVALPEDTAERVKGWVEGEEATTREREELVEQLSEAMQAHGRDPTPLREAMGD
jgi:hypothetical protein